MEYLKEKGRIFDIQRFSVHDGPGIRTIVFLKGCMLRCRWCCNPESQEFAVQSMVQGGRTKIMGRDVTVREVVSEVAKDRIYYRRSGGGMTLSGGECFYQPHFATALLCAAKAAGINTAVESTSCVPYKTIEEALPCIDNYLMDIKHMNSSKHKEFTGVANELILENARRLSKDAANLIIRVPVIPGFNDTAEEITAIAEFTAGLGTVRELHLLPYHRLGKDKYKGLGRDYPMGDAQLHTKDTIEELKRFAEKTGLEVIIGG
ncbi:MAG: glycyl-radical enzyme activating protein [Clostridia bacterium]|nr:glycyl-radical enzyme activating protein [Clostridia bacterium]